MFNSISSWSPIELMLGAGYGKQGKSGYVSWKGKHNFLTPVHNWIHNCIWYWTWKWDTDLMMSTVQPNSRQGIIAMLSGGMVGRFHEPIWGKKTKCKTLHWRLKVQVPSFYFPHIGVWPPDYLPYFWQFDRYLPKGPQVQTMSRLIPHLG